MGGSVTPRSVLAIAFALVAVVSGLVGLLAGGGGAVRSTATAAAVPVAASDGAGGGSFADVVQRVNPAVVHIAVVEGGARGAADPHAPLGPGRETPRRGEGSGFVVDPTGLILTNHHLVSSPSRIRVRLADKRELPATLVGSDANTDLALIKVAGENLAAVPLGDSDRLRVGEWVCAIGNPYSFEHSVTVGVVSSKGRKIWDASFDAYIQTDAAINPGNSGGPLINAAGEAVGINAAVSTEGQGIGFAIPINVAKDVLDQLRTKGRVTRGYLGVQLHEIDPDFRKLLELPGEGGAVVLDVLPGSAGEAAGLRRYDVITAVSGRPVSDSDQLVRTIAGRPPGTQVTLTVFRDGREISVPARLAERGADTLVAKAEAPDAEPVSSAGDGLGLSVAELSGEMRESLGIPAERRGVVVREILGLYPGIETVQHGDIVIEVNRQPTPDVASYRDALRRLSAGESAWLFVYRPRPGRAFLAKLEVQGRS